MSWASEESSAAVGEALEQWVSALPAEEPSADIGILGDWVAVVSMVRVNSEGQPMTQYYLAMKGGTMLPHVVKGLLYEGLDEARSGTVQGDD